MKRLILLGIVLAFSFSGVINIPEDKANHFIMGACLGKVINTYVPNKSDASLLKSVIFIGKEFFDNMKSNPTGFSLEDLVYDYFGDGVVTWELKF